MEIANLDAQMNLGVATRLAPRENIVEFVTRVFGTETCLLDAKTERIRCGVKSVLMESPKGPDR